MWLCMPLIIDVVLIYIYERLHGLVAFLKKVFQSLRPNYEDKNWYAQHCEQEFMFGKSKTPFLDSLGGNLSDT